VQVGLNGNLATVGIEKLKATIATTTCKKHHAEADKLDKATIPIRNVSTTVQ
jgi:hypothetical protein